MCREILLRAHSTYWLKSAPLSWRIPFRQTWGAIPRAKTPFEPRRIRAVCDLCPSCPPVFTTQSLFHGERLLRTNFSCGFPAHLSDFAVGQDLNRGILFAVEKPLQLVNFRLLTHQIFSNTSQLHMPG